MCPACYNLNNMHALTVFQMNLRQAIYMCSNAEQCLYPQGFGIEIIDRDLYLLSPESDNESDKDDMPLDSITGREFKDEKKPKIETKTEPVSHIYPSNNIYQISIPAISVLLLTVEITVKNFNQIFFYLQNVRVIKFINLFFSNYNMSYTLT